MENKKSTLFECFSVVPPVMSPVYLCGISWSYIYFISAIYKNIGVVWSAVDVDGFKRAKNYLSFFSIVLQ